MKYEIQVVIPQTANDIQMFVLVLELNVPRSQVLEKVYGWFNAGPVRNTKISSEAIVGRSLSTTLLS